MLLIILFQICVLVSTWKLFSFVTAQDPKGLEQGGDLVFQGRKEVHYDRMEALLGWNPRKSGLTTLFPRAGAPDK